MRDLRLLLRRIVTDELRPNDLEEGVQARVEWTPRGGQGRGDAAAGEVTRVWRPDEEVKEFTVQSDDFDVNVYTDYRTPVVERVEGGGDADEDPDAETVGRLDRITRE